jgi:GGDEF domain-containing protein
VILFIAVVATLNLVIGYVLGAYLGWLPAFVPRATQADEFSLAIAQPAAAAPAAAAPASRPQTAPPAPAAASAVPAATPLASANEQKQDMKHGLANFRSRLAQLKQQIDLANGDGDELDACASQLKTEGERYLDKSQQSLDSLAAMGGQEPTIEAIKGQNASIGKATAQLDKVVAADSADAKMAILAATSAELETTTAKLDDQLEAALAPESPDAAEVGASDIRDPQLGLATIESLQQLIAEHFADTDKQSQPLPVAWIRLDRVANSARPPVDRLLPSVAKLVQSCLAEGQRVAFDQGEQLLVTLAGDQVATAADRLEEIRQKVAATEFLYEGAAYPITVSCAVTDSESFADEKQLLAGLEATMNEAGRFGNNRTFHHDGHLIAPVIPAAVNVVPQTISL